MATTTPFSIPFSSPYTFEEDIDFRAFYPGEAFHHVKTRVIGYDALRSLLATTGEEKQNPFLVLIKNCKLDIGWFRDELNRRLEAALDTEMNIDDTYDTLGNIINIIEALYVINDAIPDTGKRQRLFDLQSDVIRKV